MNREWVFIEHIKSSKMFTIYKVNALYLSICLFSNQPWPGAAREKIDAFFVKQSFFYSDLFRFSSLRYSGVWGSGLRGHPCVKNLPKVGGEVRAYKQSVLYIKIDIKNTVVPMYLPLSLFHPHTSGPISVKTLRRPPHQLGEGS